MDLDLFGDFAGTSRASPWARSTACSSFIDCAGDLRSLRMVVGHYQPLADNGAPVLPVACTVRPNLSSAAGSEDKEKQAYVGTTGDLSTSLPHASLQPLATCSRHAPRVEGGGPSLGRRHRNSVT